MKLSIIIPVYNVQDYIAKCIESCLDQDLPYDEYEIIIVNDGTKDDSVKIAEKYVIKYSNIRIINRENGGLSAARNTGLQAAEGEYVWFVDSDDWIEQNCLKYLVKTSLEFNLDALCFGVKCYHKPDHIDTLTSPTQYCEVVFSGKDFCLNVNMIPAAWAAVYRRDFLNQHGLIFYEGILHEDQEFTPRAYFLAQRIMYVHSQFYYYRQREGSIMKSKNNDKKAIDLLKIADSLYDFAKINTQSGQDISYYFIKKINFLVCQSLSFNTTGNPSYKIYKAKPYYPLCVSGINSNFKEKLKYLLVNISPKLFSILSSKLIK